MNKSEVKNSQFITSSNQFSDKLVSVEPVLSPVSWLTRIFGCWHQKMGTPFTRQNRTYSTCVFCGASQEFDVKRWKHTGRYYYDSVPEKDDSHLEETYVDSKVPSSLELDRWVEEGGQNYEFFEKKDLHQD